MMRKLWLPILGSILAPLALRGQSSTPQKLSLKSRPVAVRMRSACTNSVAQSSSPTDAQRRDAREMAQRARQSAILGDATASLSQLRGAAGLDPSDPNLAYELGRAYESAGAMSNAAQEYCRFLSLAPNAAEAADVRAHVATIAPPRPDTVVTIEGTAFKRGVDASDKGQWADAEVFFTTVLRIDSTSADTYYNRALVRSMQDHRDAAADDYERYLRIRPEALDRAQVVARVNALRAQHMSASQAFGLGVVVPGGGQFYTKRPIRGILSLAAVAAAATFARMEKTTTSTTTQTATDPFGNKYSYSVTTAHKTRPYTIPGFAAAGGIALLSAIDAARYAGSVRGTSMSVSLVPTGSGIGGVVSLAIP